VKSILLDGNVPGRLTFTPSVPIVAVSQVLGSSGTDSEVWQYARDHECAIVTKDTDFSDRILATVPPPWVVHLRFGNMRRREFHELMARRWPRNEELLRTHKLVRVFEDRLEAVN